MPFYRYEPSDLLRKLIECYWIIEDNSASPVKQKIIPDGFPEIIFHYGDPYRIKLQNRWEVQPKALLAGQLTKHFYLENTGRSRVLGIKFKPSAISRLFTISMFELTDKVIALDTKLYKKLNPIREGEHYEGMGHERTVEVLNSHLAILGNNFKPGSIEKAIELIFDSHGSISVRELAEKTGTSERQLERLFKKYVGLSPKFYSRVIRFGYIFKMVEEKKFNWADVGLQAGFYDQPHFIRNFKAFTGEEPSTYFFGQPSLANFFMKK